VKENGDTLVSLSAHVGLGPPDLQLPLLEVPQEPGEMVPLTSYLWQFSHGPEC
jgi:hypothetical protein